MQQSNQGALQTVMKPLEDGLLSFNRLSEMLLSINADIVTPGCQTFDDFRKEIKEMEHNLKESEQGASKELQDLDKKTETLTADKNDLERKRQDQDAELKKLKTSLDSYESTLKMYTESRETQLKNLDSAKQTLREMEGKIQEAQTIRDVGIGLMFIPIVGWIAGKLNQFEIRKTEVKKSDDEINKSNQKISEYNELICKAHKETEEVNRRIVVNEAELQALSEKRKTVADLQGKTREVFHHLGLLSGVGSAAELQTRRQILVETIMKVTNELTPVLTQIMGDGLLPTEGLKRIMEHMETNNRKLKANISEKNKDFY
uniref:Uncharacterized protein n=1 Tax=Oryzias latipes TaxID=8090 RepID=A0A3P9KDK9_ORYLA